MKRVFVTDGSYRNALAAVRSLGASGFSVAVGELAGEIAPAYWSRYCRERFAYPNPSFAADESAEVLLRHIETMRYDAVIPVGLEMTAFFERHRHQVAAPIMLPPTQSFAIALDKGLTFVHAAANGIPVPRTLPAERFREIGLPAVFKHPRSGASIARTAVEATSLATQIATQRETYVVQEYIPGENGFGYFGFFQNGCETGYFMHERLVQYPRSGGPSVVSRSIRDERLHALGRRLLESLHWHGAAMVEFKRSALDDDYYLMEINPKLWGSLGLAIASGCDFPVWIANALIDGKSPESKAYALGTTYQCIFPIGVKAFLGDSTFRTTFLRNVFSPKVRTDLEWRDPLPSVAAAISLARGAASR